MYRAVRKVTHSYIFSLIEKEVVIFIISPLFDYIGSGWFIHIIFNQDV
jgi:hypothetical protein